jgi:tRNA (adenine58-N1)-methyltransferase non-catalytic subunit
LECYKFLKANSKAIHLELSDSWLRDYQILPERTHPKMMMDCCGGYLLTGITASG